MSFWDLIKQKWKRPDDKVRNDTVKLLDNQKKLVNVAKKDPDSSVRKEAVTKIKMFGLKLQ